MVDSSILSRVANSIRIRDGKCPNGHSLMDDGKLFDGEPSIALKIAIGGHHGTLYLNPFYGRFEKECDIPLNDGEVAEMFCTRCDVSLSIDTICKLCNIPMVGIHLPDGGQVEICPTIGCHNHSLKIVDLDTQLARMYVDETKVQM